MIEQQGRENSDVESVSQFKLKQYLRVRILNNKTQGVIDVFIDDITHIIEYKNDFLRD